MDHAALRIGPRDVQQAAGRHTGRGPGPSSQSLNTAGAVVHQEVGYKEQDNNKRKNTVTQIGEAQLPQAVGAVLGVVEEDGESKASLIKAVSSDDP
ncbi:hypothetical protein EYF80_007315 [Liparis tanakae]|uniref:Uncharacterized protein n=1 Tax=Liparis tanakae TaxID=230148 RepID=A0A4Z2IWX8_9TELE|nr:hypothetical protein EYF80_007315 [Liparis tanakae]